MCEFCSKLTIKTSEQPHVSIVDFEQINTGWSRSTISALETSSLQINPFEASVHFLFLLMVLTTGLLFSAAVKTSSEVMNGLNTRVSIFPRECIMTPRNNLDKTEAATRDVLKTFAKFTGKHLC